MAKKPKLPKGLREFEASLDDVEYMEELVKRLMDLPEHGFHRDAAAVRDALKVAAGAEQATANARDLARRIAARVWEAALANWSIKELQEVTGYDDE